jgi:protein TonB
VEAKKGNTLAKEVDQTKLLESDVTSLPTPTEEYLVSEMPVVLSEVRPIYPKEAKEKKIEGAVVLAILIDEQGLVRQVSVIEGPEVFKTGALEAMKKFRFKPAKVDGRPVAVRIRYSLNFKLEF